MAIRKIKKLVLRISEGTVETLTDFLLWYFFLVGSSVGKNSRTSYRAFIEADQALEEINYQSFKRAIDRLRVNKTIRWEKSKDKLAIEITKEGKQRLETLLPVYREKRTWDKKLYLVTYDIPEIRHKDRDLLREYLKRIGCGLLQESVWMTPYNPKETLADFVLERELGNTILVSDLGAEGTIGGERIKDLVKRVYKLDRLNDRYEDFIDKYSPGNFTKTELNFAFLKILKEDPQLPFEILPPDWLGDKAYLLLERKMT